MSKPSITSSTKPIHLTDDFIDHPLIEWISQNKKNILIAFLALFALIVFSYRFIASKTLKAEANFFQAQADFDRFEEKSIQPGNAPSSLESLSQLQLLMDQHPELHAKYDGLIAQSLLIENEVDKARPFAQASFKRTQSDSLALYQDYAETSLLMGAGNYEESLARAQSLKEKLEAKDLLSEETLYLLNLIRLAMLYQQLGQFDKEQQIWNAVENYPSSEALMAIHQLFNHPASLSQYIEERKKAIHP